MWCVRTWFCCLFVGSYVFVICFRRVHKIMKSNCELLRAHPSIRLSFSAWIRLHWIDFDEISYMSFYRKSVPKIEVPLKSENNKGYFRRRLFTFVTISRWILFRMRSVWNSYPAHLRSKSLTMIFLLLQDNSPAHLPHKTCNHDIFLLLQDNSPAHLTHKTSNHDTFRSCRTILRHICHTKPLTMILCVPAVQFSLTFPTLTRCSWCFLLLQVSLQVRVSVI
jgi:hypothetical protein